MAREPPLQGGVTTHTNDAVDAMAASLRLVQANPDGNADGGLLAFEAVLAAISAYLLDPVVVAGTLAGIDGERT